jgi:polyphosphate glucokinase
LKKDHSESDECPFSFQISAVSSEKVKSQHRILVIDVGGSHVKATCTGEEEVRRFDSGPEMTAKQMVSGVLKLIKGWNYDAISIGYPGIVMRGKIALEPHNLGAGWVGFNFEKAFKCPVKVINDAVMQAVGSYQGGKMLYLGLGTGLGSTMIVDGYVEPMELGHMPFKKKTYEDYVGMRGRVELGKKHWQKSVKEVIALMVKGLEPDYVILGGGNSKKLDTLPEKCILGNNADAFKGGFRLWGRESSKPNIVLEKPIRKSKQPK